MFRHKAKRIGRIAGVVGGLLALNLSLAEAQYFGQNKIPSPGRNWRVLESDHFDLHFYPEEREAAIEALYLAERAYERLARIFGHEMRTKVPLILYGSQTDFQQTRAAAGNIGEGTGGLTEFLKRRVVIPFTGSYGEFDHVLTHELVHAFQIDIISRPGFGNGMRSITWTPPLWVMEGLAEYLSTPGIDFHTDMWMRAAVLDGTLLSVEQLSRVGDIRVYRYGQSLISHIARNFGDEALGNWYRNVIRRRSLVRGTEESLGFTLKGLSEDWSDSLRHEHMPELVLHQDAEEVARRLTDHSESLASLFIMPAISAAGQQMVFVSNKTLYTDLYLASALDGNRTERLIRGQREETFETLRFLKTSIEWSPAEDQIALVARMGGREGLVLYDPIEQEIVASHSFDLDEMLSPTWSPNGEELIFVGLKDARSNLYRVGADGQGLAMLTSDRWATFQPAWSPDGRYVAFLTDRGYASAAYSPTASYWKIALLDLESGEVSMLPDQVGKNINPQWFPDGRHLLYVSDRTGISNLFVRALESGADYQITDLITGVSGITSAGPALSLARNGHRAVFSVFEDGGWNIYAMRDPLARIADAVPYVPPAPPIAVVVAEPDSLAAPPDVPAVAVATPQVIPPPENVPPELLRDRGERPLSEWNLADLYAETTALPESLGYSERAYQAKLSVDYATAGGLYASGYGLQAQSIIAFSDLLGDRQLFLGVDVNGQIEDGNYLLAYRNLSRRPSYGLQAYQYWTGYGWNPGLTELIERRLIRGLGISWLRPISRFRRLEMGIDLVQEKRYSYDYQEGDYLYWEYEEKEIGDTYYVRPEVAWVIDSAVFGMTGPISGRRARLAGYGMFGRQNAQGLTIDYRVYRNLKQRYAFVSRIVAAGEWGEDARQFVIGGPYSMRGFTDELQWGSKVAFGNFEFRFPFIDGVLVAFPGPILIGGIRGALFCDVGAAWDNPRHLRPIRCNDETGDCVLEDLKASFGFRASVNLGFAVLCWDLVRRSNLTRWDGKAFGELSLGMEF